MAAVGGFTDNRTPLCFPEPEPVTVTDFLRVQPELMKHHPWMLDREIPRRAFFGPSSKGRDKPLR